MFILIKNVLCSDSNTFIPETVGYSANEQLLLNVAEKNGVAHKALKDKNHNFYNIVLPAWVLQNPEPEVKPYTLTPEPKWESVPGKTQVITDEMREERKVIKAKNDEVIRLAYQEHSAWVFLRQQFTVQNFESSVYHDETYWEVQPIPEIFE